ncbi:MAG: hypothetical protein J6S43_02160 [Lentisphaeria bacterium]|nr:hypothetical protein [Lentisphaeria bacterium]
MDYPELNVPFPGKEIFLRLGGHLTKTQVDPAAACRFQRYALEAFRLCRPRGRWQIFPVTAVTDEAIILADGSSIPGGDFSRKNRDISFLWCGAVTVGKAVTETRDSLEMVSARAVYDAVAGECADGAMDMLQALAAGELLRRNLRLDKRRFSPGYGDMPLEVQKFFFSSLQLEKLDMVLNDKFFMIPEKSVTALAGVR